MTEEAHLALVSIAVSLGLPIEEAWSLVDEVVAETDGASLRDVSRGPLRDAG